jgi:DNA-directed RNA polymerase subunit RPC12/RpoP
MNCYTCKTELIWLGDMECEDEEDSYATETSLHCPNCAALVLFYTPRNKEV